MTSSAQSFALLRPAVRPTSFSGPVVALGPPTPLAGFSCGKEVQIFETRKDDQGTQEVTVDTPTLPCFSCLSQLAFCPFELKLEIISNLCFVNSDDPMNPKSLIQQRNVSRIVKGAIAGGFHVTTVKVDRDGAIVLYSASPECEEREEPRLPLKANEWDEVLKK